MARLTNLFTSPAKRREGDRAPQRAWWRGQASGSEPAALQIIQQVGLAPSTPRSSLRSAGGPPPATSWGR